MASTKPPPEDVLAALTQGATKRAQQSLDLIHTICKERYETGNFDFAISKVGGLSAARGGPSAQAIRNVTGERYRTLVQAWENFAAASNRRPPVRPEPGVAGDVLDMIDDSTVRAVVGTIIAQNRKLLRENITLKSQAQVVIDRRPVTEVAASSSETRVEVLPALSTLKPLEIEALRHAISEDLFGNMGWTVDKKTGRVSKGGLAIFRPGFVTAIQKVLDSVK